MRKEQIEKEIIDELFARTEAEGLEMSTSSVLKTNGRELTAVNIKRPDDIISPSLYLEPMVEMAREGKAINVIADQALLHFRNAIENQPIIPNIKDYSEISPMLEVVVLNYELNKQMIGRDPHKIIDDLVVVPRIKLPSNSDTTASIRVTNEMLKMWRRTDTEVISKAIKNTEEKKFSVKTLQDVMAEMLGEDILPAIDVPPVYVVSNETHNMGAQILACKQALGSAVDEIGEDVFILPASQHEILLLKKSFAPDLENLREMVHDVNETAVEASDILSNSVYECDIATKKFGRACELTLVQASDRKQTMTI